MIIVHFYVRSNVIGPHFLHQVCNAMVQNNLHVGPPKKAWLVAGPRLFFGIFVTATKLLPPVGTGHLLVKI